MEVKWGWKADSDIDNEPLRVDAKIDRENISPEKETALGKTE